MITVRPILFVLLLLIAIAAQAGNPPTYRIGVASWVGWAFIHVAQEQGFFKEAGLNMEVKWYAEPAEIERAFQKGEIQFRLDFVASVVEAYMNDHNVTLLAETNWSHGGDKIIAKKDFRMKDHKGESIAIYRDSQALVYFLNKYLNKENLRLSDFKIRNMPIEKLINSFVNDEIKFAVIFDPYTIEVVKDGNGTVRANSAQYPGCMPEGIYAKTDFLQSMPREDLLAIIGACVKGSTWMDDKNNWDELLTILNENVFPDHEPFEDNQLAAMLGYVKVHNAKTLKHRNKKGGGLTKYILEIKKNIYRSKRASGSFDIDEMFDASVLLEVLEKSDS